MFIPWFSRPETEKKVLQVVNLSPNEDIIEKLTEIHPMRQVFWASIIQVCVFGVMLLAFFTIDSFLGH
jgi:hypothetical protein